MKIPALLLLAFLVVGCAPLSKTGKPEQPERPERVEKPVEAAPPVFRPATWSELPGWGEDDTAAAWEAFLQSCRRLQNQAPWQAVCREAAALPAPDAAGARAFFEARLAPYQVQSAEGGESGLITGYYEPLLNGSRFRSERFPYPIYAVPDDLLTVDLSEVYPELKGYRLRGRLVGRKVVPYWSRAGIEDGEAPLKNKVLVYVDDPIDLFFLQIQGSGRVKLPDGRLVRVGYGDQNGHPYRSIGKWLVEQGELTVDKASMQGIKDWVRANPVRLRELLDTNPSYVFFRELPGGEGGPPGALGVPLTDGRSLAVDPRAIPLGAPLFLATTWPNSGKPLNRLMLAQDTGGAIRGAVRADFFWGFGPEAGKLAGAMRQSGRYWLLWPRDAGLPGAN